MSMTPEVVSAGIASGYQSDERGGDAKRAKNR